VEAILERQGRNPKNAHPAEIIDNSLIDQVVEEKYLESVFGSSILEEQQRRQAQASGR
jgi:hypothetical protein